MNSPSFCVTRLNHVAERETLNTRTQGVSVRPRQPTNWRHIGMCRGTTSTDAAWAYYNKTADLDLSSVAYVLPLSARSCAMLSTMSHLCLVLRSSPSPRQNRWHIRNAAQELKSFYGFDIHFYCGTFFGLELGFLGTDILFLRGNETKCLFVCECETVW